jgi:hypothetical protein
MKRYEISSPHVDMTFGVVAAAMAAITFSVLVGLPAMSVSANPQPSMLASSPAANATATEVVLYPSRIEVVAVREKNAVAADARNAQAKRGQQG